MSQATLFIGAVETGALALVLYVALSGRMRDGQSTWAAGLVLLCAAAVLALLDPWIPPWLNAPGSAVLGSAALVAFRDSLARFVVARLPRFWFALPFLVFAVRAVPQWADWSAGAAGLLLAAQAVDCALATGAFGEEVSPRLRRLLAGAFLLAGGSLLAAIGFAYAGDSDLADKELHSPADHAFMLTHLALLLACLGFAFAHANRARHRAQRLTTLDPLTELLNRRSILELGEREFLRSHRSESALSVLMLAPDNFRPLSARSGHLAADRLLVHMGELVLSAVRAQDLCGRYGADEFCLVLPETSPAGALQLAERLREHAHRTERGPDRLRSPLSIGVASRIADDMEHGSLLARAEAALHRAQEAGGDRVAQAPESLS